MPSKRRRPRLSLDLLKGFEAAARHLSFTHAARELSLTHSAVSREIKTLEDQLGEPLFTRINRGLRLTDAGQVLYRAVGEALTLIDEATDRLSASKGGEMLTVTTSVPLTSMSAFQRTGSSSCPSRGPGGSSRCGWYRSFGVSSAYIPRSMCAALPQTKGLISSGSASTSRSGGPPWVERPRRRAAVRHRDFSGLLAGARARSFAPPSRPLRILRTTCCWIWRPSRPADHGPIGAPGSTR